MSARLWQEAISAAQLAEAEESGLTQVHLILKPVFPNDHAIILVNLLKKDRSLIQFYKMPDSISLHMHQIQRDS